MPTAHIVRVRAVLDFVGILPVGGAQLSPEDAVKQKFKLMDASISGFVLENKSIVVSTKPIQEEQMP